MPGDYLDRLPPSLRKPGNAARGEITLLPPGNDPRFGILYEDQHILLLRDRVQFPGGKEGAYIRIVDASDLASATGVVMVPLWNREIIFIRIFRHATRTWEWELPRGFGEAALSEQANAEREIQEELGIGSNRVRRIGEIHPNTGLLSSLIGVYAVDLASDPAANGRPQTEEGIARLQAIPIPEAAAFAAGGGVRCGITLAALFLYLNQIQEGGENYR